MEKNTKLTIGAIITLMVAMSGTYYLADGNESYYCEEKDMVMICEKLSSGLGTRCYYDDTYKICKLGWEKIEIGQEVRDLTLILSEVPDSAEGIKWSCSPEGCKRIE